MSPHRFLNVPRAAIYMQLAAALLGGLSHPSDIEAIPPESARIMVEAETQMERRMKVTAALASVAEGTSTEEGLDVLREEEGEIDAPLFLMPPKKGRDPAKPELTKRGKERLEADRAGWETPDFLTLAVYSNLCGIFLGEPDTFNGNTRANNSTAIGRAMDLAFACARHAPRLVEMPDEFADTGRDLGHTAPTA